MSRHVIAGMSGFQRLMIVSRFRSAWEQINVAVLPWGERLASTFIGVADHDLLHALSKTNSTGSTAGVVRRDSSARVTP